MGSSVTPLYTQPLHNTRNHFTVFLLVASAILPSGGGGGGIKWPERTRTAPFGKVCPYPGPFTRRRDIIPEGRSSAPLCVWMGKQPEMGCRLRYFQKIEWGFSWLGDSRFAGTRVETKTLKCTLIGYHSTGDSKSNPVPYRFPSLPREICL